jgi:hypothetical protein
LKIPVSKTLNLKKKKRVEREKRAGVNKMYDCIRYAKKDDMRETLPSILQQSGEQSTPDMSKNLKSF